MTYPAPIHVLRVGVRLGRRYAAAMAGRPGASATAGSDWPVKAGEALARWWHHAVLPHVGAAGLIAAGLLCGVVALRLVVSHRRRRPGIDEAQRFRILPPPEAQAEGATMLWMGLHGLLRPLWRRILFGQPHLAWELVGRPEEVQLSLLAPAGTPPCLVEKAVESAWPGARALVVPTALRLVDEVGRSDPRPLRWAVTELGLARPDCYPLEAHDDPLRLLLGSMSAVSGDEVAVVQVLACPATVRARGRVLAAARHVKSAQKTTGRSPSFVADPAAMSEVREILAKGRSPLWHCQIRLAVGTTAMPRSRGLIHSLAGAFGVFEGLNGFRRRRVHGGVARLHARALTATYLLSVPELAQIAGLPGAGAQGVERAGARTVAPPRAVPTAGKVIGESDHPAVRRPVAISVPDATQHVHIMGENGTGKSTMVAQMVLQDAAAGRGAAVIDPHGDLVDAILERLPQAMVDRTCVVDPEDLTSAVGLNVLAGEDPDLVVDHVVAALRRIYEAHWGPRTDDIMRATCLTLTQIPGATLAEIPLLLTHFEWRRDVLAALETGAFAGPGAAAGFTAMLRSFWGWYDRSSEAKRAEYIAPLMNKLRQFLLRASVRAIVGQSSPKGDVAGLLDAGGLLLVRVPKGTLGEETSKLLGAFVVGQIWQARMGQIRLPVEHRRDVGLYVDEMHNYIHLPRSFEDMLAEARKYRLGLVLAHQHFGQLTTDMREALGANARTKVIFVCSPTDAKHLERYFMPELAEHDLAHLERFQAACRPCIQGGHGRAFTFRTLPLPPAVEGRAAEVRRRSAELWGRPRTEVEREIGQRHRRPGEHLIPGRAFPQDSPPRGVRGVRLSGPESATNVRPLHLGRQGIDEEED